MECDSSNGGGGGYCGRRAARFFFVLFSGEALVSVGGIFFTSHIVMEGTKIGFCVRSGEEGVVNQENEWTDGEGRLPQDRSFFLVCIVGASFPTI